MMLKRIALAMLSMAILAGSSLAQFSTTNAGPVNSAGDVGDPGNSVFTSTYSGVSSLYGSFSFSGNLTAVIPATWAEEASFDIQQTTALGGLTGVTLSPAIGEDFVGTLPVSFTTNGLFWFTSGAQYQFEAFETFDDGAGTDATWTDLEFTFSDTVTTTNIGSFLVGTPLVFDTEGSQSGLDTELAAFTSTGTFLSTDDDSGTSTLSLLNLGTLPVGNYNLVLGTFNSSFGDGFAVPGSGSGTFVVNVNGSPVSSGNLAANTFHVLSFNISAAPEPGTLALLALAALPCATLLRRRK